MNKEHIKDLDYFRGIAAMLVVLYHYTTQYNNSIGHLKNYPINLSWGYMAVSIFFILSGFLAVLNLKDSDKIFSFMYKRIIRLYPVYWVCIIITTIAMIFLLPDRVQSLPTILINFSMLQGFIGAEAVDGVYWTLRYEIIFYSLIGLLIIFKQRKNINKICMTVIVFAIALSVLKSLFNNVALTVLSVIIIPNYVQTFTAGIMLYSLYENNKQKIPHIVIIFCLINQYINFGIGYTIFFAAVIFLLYCVVYGVKIKMVFYNPITHISRISYPLYLIHQFVGFGIIKLMEGYGLTNEVFIIIPISISIVISYVLNKFIEKPSLAYLRRKNPFEKKYKMTFMNIQSS